MGASQSSLACISCVHVMAVLFFKRAGVYYVIYSSCCC
eukprot:COSAG01_NODE_9549_length_2413_cov_2.239844_4_plen_37_part_01